MFPFIVKYSKRVNEEDHSQISNRQILEYLKEQLKKDGVDRVVIRSETRLLFDNDFYSIRPNLNWNIWQGVHSGHYKIIDIENERKIILVINITATSVFSIGFVILGLYSNFIFFEISGLLIWLTHFLRQKFYFKELINNISNKLKPEQ